MKTDIACVSIDMRVPEVRPTESALFLESPIHNIRGTFFCYNCQRDKPVAKKVRVGKASVVRCQDCVDGATQYRLTGLTGDSGWKNQQRQVEDYDRYAVPAEALEAYRESVDE